MSTNILPHRNDGTHKDAMESVEMFNLLTVTTAHCKANGQKCNMHMLGADHFCLYKVYMEYLANVRA